MAKINTFALLTVAGVIGLFTSGGVALHGFLAEAIWVALPVAVFWLICSAESSDGS